MTWMCHIYQRNKQLKRLKAIFAKSWENNKKYMVEEISHSGIKAAIQTPREEVPFLVEEMLV